MAVALITHEACLGHDPGPGHPERIDRLRAVLAALGEEAFPDLIREQAPRATAAQLSRAHDPAFVAALLAVEVPEGEHRALDPDTVLSHGSLEAALRAAGGAVHAVDLIMQGRAQTAFAAVRPPGHHAEPGRAMGFCLFNNVAVAARHAIANWGLDRVAIADFDVHHGNGSQAMVWDDPALCIVSSHQSPCYPGTGATSERGAHANVFNAPLSPGSGSAEFRQAWQRELLPALDAFAPELLIISAGFDAHRADPLAQLRLETDDYAWVTRELVLLAGRHAGGRVVTSLEGGYELGALAECAGAHVESLSNHNT